MFALSAGQAAQAENPSPVDLGAATPFVILTKSGITNVPTSQITGDLGVSPIASDAITGFSLILDRTRTFSRSAQINGKIYAADYAAPTPSMLTTAISNMEAAYADSAGRTLPDFTELYAGDLSGKTLAPGLYKWSTGVLITSDVTLAGPPNGVWIFQIAGDLTVGSGAKMVLSNGAKAENIFWQVGGGVGVEINTTAHVEGTLLAAAAIHLRTGATMNGRALAQTAVTLEKNRLVLASLAPQQTFVSNAGKDGWILEDSEINGIGGSINKSAYTIYVGDTQNNKQYRGILYFNTASLPNNAVITSATLKIKASEPPATDIFTNLGNLSVDIQKPFFGTRSSLQKMDFEAASANETVASFDVTPVDQWYSAALSSDAYSFINLKGATQLRLRFALSTNNDAIADTLHFFSGPRANRARRPQLVISYYVPVKTLQN